jgi:hypothetical protein
MVVRAEPAVKRRRQSVVARFDSTAEPVPGSAWSSANFLDPNMVAD